MIKIAIASGKGGTGKTLISTNLFSVVKENSVYVDCDVEEPNGHLFLKPDNIQKEDVNMLIPKVDESKCTYCGHCSEICEYNAIITAKKKMLIFPEMCHACGSCAMFCPQNAISEIARPIGIIEKGIYDNKTILTGRLNIGEPMAPPVIKKLKENINDKHEVAILDSPPGTSCPVIEAVRDANYVILVTEPTPFGLNDLKLAVEVVRKLGLSFGVVINKSGLGKEIIEDYCSDEQIKVLMKVPHDVKIAQIYSRGEILANNPEYKTQFEQLYQEIKSELQGENK